MVPLRSLTIDPWQPLKGSGNSSTKEVGLKLSPPSVLLAWTLRCRDPVAKDLEFKSTALGLTVRYSEVGVGVNSALQ